MYSSSGNASHARAPRWFLRSSILLVAFAILLAGGACATVTVGTTNKIVVDLSIKFFDDSAPATPTLLSKEYTATCPQGQSVLAGGYNLAVRDVSSDWLATDPVPSGAQVDANGLYRPVPQLIRVVASHPSTLSLDGWTIKLEGMSYPDSDRKIAVFAYCAGGLSVAPTMVVGSSSTSNSNAICSNGSLISGGGYTTGKYTYDESQHADLPLYVSAAEGNNSWAVNSYKSLFEPAVPATFTAVGVCVSKQDFIKEDLPQVATMRFNPASWASTDVHGKPVYTIVSYGASPCPSGALMLPAEYVADNLGNADIRVDGVWENITLDQWTASLSVGRAASYTGESPIMYIYVLCLTPKLNLFTTPRPTR